MILCYELPIRFPQDTEAPQNVTLIMLFSLKVDEYNHSCAGSESNDTTTIKTQAFVLSGAGGTTSASIVNLAVASPLAERIVRVCGTLSIVGVENKSRQA